MVFRNEQHKRIVVFALRDKLGNFYIGTTPEEVYSETNLLGAYRDVVKVDKKENPLYWTLFIWP